MVVSWLLFGVSFALGFFIYGPLALPFLQKTRAPGAPAGSQEAAVVVLGVGGVLLLGIVLGLLGVLVCGIGWFRARRQIKSAAA